jgi:hypothetical protein
MRVVLDCDCWRLLRASHSGNAQANPARPTVSTPATLSPSGYLQFENGTLGASDSPEFNTRVGANQVTKSTVLPRLELFLQSEPLVLSRNVTDRELQPGEVFAGFQGVLLPGMIPAQRSP